MKTIKKFSIIIGGALAIGLILLAAQYFLAGGRGRMAELSFPERNLSLSAELSLTPKQHQRGLMGRTHLSREKAMLFVFSEDEKLSFWMKDTLIPLDLVFVSSGLRVVDIKNDFQPCFDSFCSAYVSIAPAKYVVEMSAGLAAEKGLNIGDRLEIKIK